MNELTFMPSCEDSPIFTDFNQMPLSSLLIEGLQQLGYKTPTKVQQEVFEPLRQGRDLLVQSQTGSGKTAAFCLPILSQLQVKPAVQALILVPTRELARQVATECSRLGHAAGFRVCSLYGGASFEAQLAVIKSGCQVVVGTPGRVKEWLQNGLLNVSSLRTAVLDEADEMLSKGFWEDVTAILNYLPLSRQTLFFSATIPPALEATIPLFLKDPLLLKLSSNQINAQGIRHLIHQEDETQPKFRNLLYALEFHHPSCAIVFCNTRDETDLLEKYLRRFGFHAKALHGDMLQKSREEVIQEIKEGALNIIIATDIAARGIDIPGLTHVFNYELPQNDELYIHRTGRTGRMGKTGTAVNLVRGRDMSQLYQLKSKYDLIFEEMALPAEKEILWMQAERLAAALTEELEGVEISQYRPVAESMLQRGDGAELFAFLLRAFYARQLESSVTSIKALKEPKSAQKPAHSHPRPSRTSFQKPHKKEPSDAEASTALSPSDVDSLDKPVFLPQTEEGNFTRLYITLGRQDGFASLTALADFISSHSGVDLGHFTGEGQLRDTSSHIEVDFEVASRVIESMHGYPRNKEEEKEPGQTPKAQVVCEAAKGGRPFVSQRRRPYRSAKASRDR